MQIPSLLIGIVYGIFIAATDPDRASNMSNFNIEMTDEVMLLTLFMTLFVALAVSIFARGFLKRNNESLGLTNTNKGKNYLKGLAIGFLMLAGSVFALRILGMIELNLNLANISPLIFIAFVIGWMIQGFEEELVTRSVVMNFFAAKRGVMVGIIANSVIFSLLHLGNNAFSVLPFINILLVGTLYSLLFYLSDDIFLPAAAHSFWNFAQGNIFGIEVSGMDEINSTIFKTKIMGSDLISGGAFGFEGSIFVTLVEIIMIFVIIRIIKRRNLYIDKIN